MPIARARGHRPSSSFTGPQPFARAAGTPAPCRLLFERFCRDGRNRRLPAGPPNADRLRTMSQARARRWSKRRSCRPGGPPRCVFSSTLVERSVCLSSACLSSRSSSPAPPSIACFHSTLSQCAHASPKHLSNHIGSTPLPHHRGSATRRHRSGHLLRISRATLQSRVSAGRSGT